MLTYVWRELIRNPSRSFTSLVGVVLGTALFSGVLFFIDGSAATMTSRAIAPLPLDMQLLVTAPQGLQLTLTEEVSTTGGLKGGEALTFTLRVTNQGKDPQHEVVVRDEPPTSVSYLANSTTRDGSPIPDRDGETPLSHGPSHTGLNLGTVPPETTVTVTYQARVMTASTVDLIDLDATVSSRENVVPIPANQPPPMGVAELAARIGSIPVVTSADVLSFVDVPPGSLQADDHIASGLVRVFAFGPSYESHYPSVRVVAGGFSKTAVMLSAEAAQSLGAEPGSTVSLSLPGASQPIPLQVSGVVDLSEAKPLFSSRKTSKFEDFLYVPNSVVMSQAMFQSLVVPAYSTASATPDSNIFTFPVSEVDVLIDRSNLYSDPAEALAQTKQVAGQIEQIGFVEGSLIDNISNALEVARDDARAGKRMFLFIGLPGALLAAFLAAYAGKILGATQRREHALLRVRGAHRGHLVRMLVWRALLFSTVGSVLGTAVGLLSVLPILGPGDLLAASPIALTLSAVLAITLGMVVTSLAFYLPGHRSLRREIAQERHELDPTRTSAWRRWWLDVVAIMVASVGSVIALRAGAFDTESTSVSMGQSVILPTYLLGPPMVAWIGGALLSVRLVETICRHLPVTDAGYGPVLFGTLLRSIRRRAPAIAIGVAGVTLICALGTTLAVFASTYQAAKVADARFGLGSDLRFTPSVLGAAPYPISASASLKVDGIEETTPVIFQLENAVLIGRFDQNLQDLAAIDPDTFSRVAPLPDTIFVDGSAAEAMDALANDPRGLLITTSAAEDLSIEPGDQVEVLLARGTDHQSLTSFQVVGLFDEFPGFPQGVDLIVDASSYSEATGLDEANFFLAKTIDSSPDGVGQAAVTLQQASGTQPFGIETSQTTLLKDQSSLTAINIRGLVDLDSTYTLLMSSAVMGLFIFGLMLQRRREYATLHARGLANTGISGLILGEAAVVATAGIGAGLLTGLGMAHLFVNVLRPLFILEPTVTIEGSVLAVIGSVPLAAAVIAALAAPALLQRRRGELLRET